MLENQQAELLEISLRKTRKLKRLERMILETHASELNDEMKARVLNALAEEMRANHPSNDAEAVVMGRIREREVVNV